MKQHKKLGTFFSGMLAGIMLLGCGTAALAAGAGGISLDAFGLAVNGSTVAERGAQVVNDSGCQIPTTIVYTDETGGGNTYLPISLISKMLNVPISWKDHTVYLGYASASGGVDISQGKQPISQVWLDQPQDGAGAQAGPYTELEPFWPEETDEAEDRTILFYQDMDTRISSPLLVSGSYRPDPIECHYSVSITNHTNIPLLLHMGTKDTLTRTRLPDTIIPAGETIVRTFHVDAYEGYLAQPELYYTIERDEAITGNHDRIDVTLNSVCFQA